LPRLEGEDSLVHGCPPGFLVHRADAADLAAFGDFGRRTFIATYGAMQTQDAMARHVADRFSDGRLREELADPARTVLALKRGDAWVGCAQLRSGEAPASVAGTRSVEIERFYVDQEWQGQGLAALLMAETLATARPQGHDVAWLAVWQENPRAIRFYEKQGFRVVGRQIYMFDDRAEDDYLMSRSV
jgi:ribosomal protein S18 acetylase RimI-like enzyme